ncbi:Putative teichuronic acid biosynthesis glycosyltransferase TuaC (plasmid) [Sulfitobacter indolifex]|uniref:glycosyltransferase family 4 protein n=1 Tax=Sulfitobacter indolifex TaxID=225422 RepID=UPI001FAC07A0|nr:glycosyltransferase family 4 protein [Sulfitobacter indolifex]UOA20693.1 Putative teichuronic acid biosynthesis glycosyltransferase TuaC [Sulfitobacter indolifex]
MTKTLILGPRASESCPGGITVLFEQLLSEYNASNRSYTVCDTNSQNYNSRIGMLFHVLMRLARLHDYDHVSLHGTAADYKIIGPFLCLLNALSTKTYSLRKFAGNFDEYYRNSTRIEKFLMGLCLKYSVANFFETQALVSFFKRFNRNTYWFPNSRPASRFRAKPYAGGRVDIVFLSQVMKQKGILDLVEITARNPQWSLTIAGPIRDRNLHDIIENTPGNIEYIGPVPNADVQSFLSGFHLLALPTYFEGEGYPGVLIEAFSVGLPVVTTHWGCIPEMVGSAAALAEPENTNSLETALRKVISFHEQFRTASAERFIDFETSLATSRFFESLDRVQNYKLPGTTNR